MASGTTPYPQQEGVSHMVTGVTVPNTSHSEASIPPDTHSFSGSAGTREPPKAFSAPPEHSGSHETTTGVFVGPGIHVSKPIQSAMHPVDNNSSTSGTTGNAIPSAGTDNMPATHSGGANEAVCHQSEASTRRQGTNSAGDSSSDRHLAQPNTPDGQLLTGHTLPSMPTTGQNNTQNNFSEPLPREDPGIAHDRQVANPDGNNDNDNNMPRGDPDVDHPVANPGGNHVNNNNVSMQRKCCIIIVTIVSVFLLLTALSLAIGFVVYSTQNHLFGDTITEVQKIGSNATIFLNCYNPLITKNIRIEEANTNRGVTYNAVLYKTLFARTELPMKISRLTKSLPSTFTPGDVSIFPLNYYYGNIPVYTASTGNLTYHLELHNQSTSRCPVQLFLFKSERHFNDFLRLAVNDHETKSPCLGVQKEVDSFTFNLELTGTYFVAGRLEATVRVSVSGYLSAYNTDTSKLDSVSCSLDSDNSVCNIDISSEKSESVCILARSLVREYNNVTITQENHDFNSTSIAMFVFSIFLFSVLLLFCIFLWLVLFIKKIFY